MDARKWSSIEAVEAARNICAVYGTIYAESISVYTSIDKCDELQRFNYRVKKSDVWIPHALNRNNKNQWDAICTSFLARH